MQTEESASVRVEAARKECEMAHALTRRPEQRRAGVAARDRDHRRHHQVLDERARDNDLDGVPVAIGDGVGNLFDGFTGLESAVGEANLSVLLLDVFLVTEKVNAARNVRILLRTLAVHGRLERLARGDVHVAVHLLVVDDDVEVLAREVRPTALLRAKGLGRGHAVELADLGGALEHLDAVGVCGRGGGNA